MERWREDRSLSLSLSLSLFRTALAAVRYWRVCARLQAKRRVCVGVGRERGVAEQTRHCDTQLAAEGAIWGMGGEPAPYGDGKDRPSLAGREQLAAARRFVSSGYGVLKQ